MRIEHVAITILHIAFACPPFVSLNVKVGEERQKGDHIANHGVLHPQRKATAHAYGVDPHSHC